MAGFTPADGDLVQLRTVSYTPTQVAINTYNYQQFSHVNAGLTLQEIALAFDNHVSGAYKSLMSSASRWRGVDAVNLMAPQTVPYISVINDGVGLVGANSAPPQTSFLLTFKTSLRGRRYIGHVYPGFPSATYQLAGGGLDPAGVAVITALAALIGPTVVLTAGANSVTLYLTVRHPSALVGGIFIPQWTTVFNVLPSPLFATQRRRGQFGAQNLPPF